MAVALLEGDSDMDSDVGSTSTVESTASGQKRKRPASVITKPMATRAKAGRGDYGHRTAGWLTGKPEPERGLSSRPYRPRGHWRGGRDWGRTGWRGGCRGWGSRRGGFWEEEIANLSINQTFISARSLLFNPLFFFSFLFVFGFLLQISCLVLFPFFL